MPAHIYRLNRRVRHSPRPQYEIDIFNELMNRACNVYDSTKHLNPPKDKIISAAINECRNGVFKVPRNGNLMPTEINEQRLRDYSAGLTDRELSKRWGICSDSVCSWRLRKGLKPNKRG